ncbi:MAG: hypothetical protein HPY85_03445 [Anaerolineae bacterium]|nr:hypothetical protein [Anaerolineae bacterium]
MENDPGTLVAAPKFVIVDNPPKIGTQSTKQMGTMIKPRLVFYITLDGIGKSNISQCHQCINILKAAGLTVLAVNLPTDGPIGHLLRVSDQGRLTFDTWTTGALTMVDALDYFDVSSSKTPTKQDVTLVHFNLSDLLRDQAEMQLPYTTWLFEVMSILPIPDLLILSAESATPPPRLPNLWDGVSFRTPDEFIAQVDQFVIEWREMLI